MNPILRDTKDFLGLSAIVAYLAIESKAEAFLARIRDSFSSYYFMMAERGPRNMDPHEFMAYKERQKENYNPEILRF